VMLLERGQAKEALAAFEATLKKEPNRLGTYVGAAKAASKAGDGAKAKQYAAKVNALTKEADSSRQDVQELKTLTTAAAAPAR
jgi:Tfp pilus assembly protein PilF